MQWHPRGVQRIYHVTIILSIGLGLVLVGCGPTASGSQAYTTDTSTPQNQPSKITQFAVPTAQSGPAGITVGPDGNLWFTEWTGNQIGRLTPDGQFTEFPIPTPASRWLVKSGRKVVFNWIEVGRLLLRHPFHHLVPYPYLTNQRLSTIR